MPLPRHNTPEWEKEAAFYLRASEDEVKERAEALKILYPSYQRRMREAGIFKYRRDDIPEINDTALTDLERTVLDIVSKQTVSVSEISRRIDRSSETVIKTIDSLRAKHYEVELDEIRHEVSIPTAPRGDVASTEFTYFRKFYRIGLVSDTHLGSKYQQVTALYDAYKIFDERKTDFNLVVGDVHDGIDMYRGHRDEIFLYDASQQLNYSAEVFPKSIRGTKTYVIGGQHDYCFMKQNGYNIIEHLCEKREDLVYRGFYTAKFNIKGILLEMQHPGGGIAYALSYAPQKMIESIVHFMLSAVTGLGEARAKLPQFLAFGHYHVPVHLPQYMGVDVCGLPCFQSQTKYLQQKRKMPIVGCAIAELWLNEVNTLSSSNVEFIIMNDRIKENDY